MNKILKILKHHQKQAAAHNMICWDIVSPPPFVNSLCAELVMDCNHGEHPNQSTTDLVKQLLGFG